MLTSLDLDPYSSAGHHDGFVTTATTVSNLRGNQRIRFDFGSLFSFLGGYYTMIGTLVALTEFMSRKKSLSPMETHGPFMMISYGALCMITAAAGIMFYTKNAILSPAYDLILDIVFWFSLILSPLSLVVVIMIPQKLIWVGYTVVVFVVPAVMLAFYLKRLTRRRLPEAIEMV